MEEIWKEIAERPGYWVSSLGRVKHILKDGKEKELKLYRGCQVQIHAGRKYLNISISKLMYAVFNDIELHRLDDICVSGNTLSELRAFTLQDFLEDIRKRTKPYCSVEALQMEAYRDMQTIIDVWNSGDASALFARIEPLKEEMIDYVSYKFKLKHSTAEELWSTARLIIVEKILFKKGVVLSFRGFLKGMIRYLALERRKQIKKILVYDDHRSNETY